MFSVFFFKKFILSFLVFKKTSFFNFCMPGKFGKLLETARKNKKVKTNWDEDLISKLGTGKKKKSRSLQRVNMRKKSRSLQSANKKKKFSRRLKRRSRR